MIKILRKSEYQKLLKDIEDYKSGFEQKRRLKVLGKLSTKMQLEGKLETVMYAEVKKDGAETVYLLHTENDGTNTARSPMNCSFLKYGVPPTRVDIRDPSFCESSSPYLSDSPFSRRSFASRTRET